MNTFPTLLKREFWEHKGGMLWAPVVTGIIASFFAIVGVGGGTLLVNHARKTGSMSWEHNGISPRSGTDAAREMLGGMGETLFAGGIAMSLTVMAFVVFFYALGSLYDDRRDRSILFWKSMPVSEHSSVLAKVTWALLLAPAMSLGLGVVLGLTILLIVTMAGVFNGFPDASSLFLEARIFRVAGSAVAMLPIQALWSLPTVGWLMLCSAWARRLPLLWAVLTPILSCAMISLSASIAGSMSGATFPYGQLWYCVVYRGLFSIVPMTWTANEHVKAGFAAIQPRGPQDLAEIIDAGASYATLGTVDLWCGVALGVAMIALAIRLRRWREDA